MNSVIYILFTMSDVLALVVYRYYQSIFVLLQGTRQYELCVRRPTNNRHPIHEIFGRLFL